MRSTLLILFALASALAQGPNSRAPWGLGLPPNNYESDKAGFYYYPKDIVGLEACLYDQHRVGNVIYNEPRTSWPVYLNHYVTQGSGGHDHEFRQGNIDRPDSYFVTTPQGQNTGQNGCARWVLHFPNIAGWYTAEALALEFQPQGENFQVRQYSSPGNVKHGAFLDMQWYPDDQSKNTPQGLDVDQNHSQGTRWFVPSVITQLQAASVEYNNDMFNLLNTYDRVNVQRGSTRWGGLADSFKDARFLIGHARFNLDNEIPKWEEHGYGIEADIWNPSAPGSQGGELNGAILIKSMIHHTCTPGLHEPGQPIDDVYLWDAPAYWLTQDYFHIVCAPARRLRTPKGQ